MRKPLKVEYKQQAVRHNLDLYNNDSLDKWYGAVLKGLRWVRLIWLQLLPLLISLLEEYMLELNETTCKGKGIR